MKVQSSVRKVIEKQKTEEKSRNIFVRIVEGILQMITAFTE